ncbi:hypothetical protein NC653_016797 [Populus alba x Populus x berolinensis]|uniref:Uncharacterized protein n=1 Tax=Populus alba x Populus x berolinensis TaxID=444605 RepID=A0AAD6QNQ2_9ROSI|nr:hypothetical protein NC653_016797 [Populus alba x Populus x berolinensis]
MVFLESSLFESSRCVFNFSSKKHWTLTIMCVTLFEPIGGVVVGGLVLAILDVVEAGAYAIEEGGGSQTAYMTCNSS